MKKIYALILLMCCFGFSALAAPKSPIKRVEPLNWWVGMHNPEIQILVYGENISSYRPEISYPGVKIVKTVQTENPNYLFVYVNISPETQAGEVTIAFKKGEKTAFTHKYPLLNRQKDSEKREGFSSADIMYLLMPDRFANGNTANDSEASTAEKVNRGDMNGRHGGDFEGIIKHLDYLEDLGITAIWNNPVLEDNMPTYSYHQYACSDYYRIDPRFGTNEDYARLSAEAKKHGIKIIMDFVTNHCGGAHWWMKDLPCADWVHPYRQCNFRVWTVQDPYTSQIDHDLNVQGWFDGTMPDLNQNNPLVLDYLTQCSIWWIEYANLGGLRIDTYPYNYPKAMAEYNKRIIGEYPDFNIVGEVWMHEPIECAYWQKGALNHDGFNSELPTVMDFPLSDLFSVFTKEKQEGETGITRLYKHFGKDYLYPNPNNLLLFLDNHDTERIFRQLGNNISHFKLAFTVLSTVRGIPQIYYGTELMMNDEKTKGDGYVRQDFPGGWAEDTINAFSAEGRTKEQNEVFNFMRTLLNWRKANPVIYNGKMKHYQAQDEVYVYFRYNDEKKVMVVINNDNDAEKTLKLDRFSEMLTGISSGKNIIDNQSFELKESLKIPAKTAMILELK